MPDDSSGLERAIAGALRATIKDHGPITVAHIGSAVKRIVGNLKNAQLGELAAADMGRRRWEGVSKEEHSEITSRAGALGGKAAWAAMSAEARSEEMKRRAAVRKRAKA